MDISASGAATTIKGTLTVDEKATLNGDVDILNPAVGTNVVLTIGKTGTEALVITAAPSAAPAADVATVTFMSKTATSTADRGKMVFGVDEVNILSLTDAGLVVHTESIQGSAVGEAASVFSSTTAKPTLGGGLWISARPAQQPPLRAL